MIDANRYQAALLRHFAERPSAIFCRQIGGNGEAILTWADLEVACGRFAGAYAEAGLRAGDQALIFLRHRPELYGAFFGAMLIGITPSFMPCASPRQDPGLYWASHQTLLERIRPAAIVTDRATLAEMKTSGLYLGESAVVLVEAAKAAALVPRFTNEGATALLQHSSGTTGLKKGVALSFAAITNQIESYAQSVVLTGDDAIVSWLPLYHDMGLIACLILPAYFGIPITHIDPFHWVGRPESLFERLASDAGTLTWLPNFAFEHMVATVRRKAGSWDLSSVRAFINCSEPCKSDTFDRFAAAFAPAGVRADQLQCCYAMAETVFAVSQTETTRPPVRIVVDPRSVARGSTPRDLPGGIELVSAGAPISGIEVTILDEHGAAIANDQVGEIALAGEFLFSSYNFDPDLSAKRLSHGLYASRDLGFFRDGELFILGRTDDLIIVNGRNLYAHDVEARINLVAGVKRGRVAALAWFDRRIGSETLIILAERDAANTRGDDDLCKEIAGVIQAIFNVAPRDIALVESGRLIKTSSGKISRKETLARYLADSS